MANYYAIKAAVNAYIKQNGRKEITGSILNAVLNATIDSLGRFFQFAGGAMPTDDPGTPDQNVCYLATEPGLYTHFGGIRIANEEVALLFWNGEWVKESITLGIQEVNASVDNQVGTPSVDVSYSGGQLVLTFHNLKGEQGETGDPAGFGTIGADINGGVGTPGVSVETSGDNTAKNLMFHFTNLKGETGVTSVVATIDNTSGTPSCQVSLVGQQLTLAFSGLKGLKGDTGVSADYPITIYNGLDSDATDQALAAAQGKVLDGKIGQLEAEVDKLQGPFELHFIIGQYISIPEEGSTIGDPTTLSSYAYSRIYATPGDTVTIRGVGGNGPRLWAFVDTTGKVLSRAESGADTRNNPAVLTVPANTAELIVNVNKGTTYSAVYEAQNNLQKEFAERDEKIVSVETAKVSKTPGVNIFTLDNATSGKYIQADGTLGNGGVYFVTDYLKVKPSTAYFYSSGLVNNYPGASGYINFYDADRNLLSTTTSQSRSFTTPTNCAFIRASINNNYLLYAMINEGTERKEYDVFSPVGGFPEIGSRFASFVNNGEVASNATFSGDGILSNKSFFAVFQIYGTAPLDFKCGFGKGSPYGAGVHITSTEMITFSGASDSVAHTYEHGLSLSTKVRVVFSREDDDWVNITLFDDLGNSFSGRNQNSHIGVPYVTNLSENSNTVKMSQSSRDSNKPIIICGDSYWSLKDTRRIPHHLHEWGYKNYELVARSGITGAELLPYIRAIIESGARPKYIVWAMGMNGGADVNGAVNPTWLSNTQEFISMCLNYGITPVLCTIPSVPSEIHTQLNLWVLTSKFRCIDFNASVFETGTYYWRGWGTENALLSEDEVHPTEKGATILAERLLLDFPEIAVL